MSKESELKIKIKVIDYRKRVHALEVLTHKLKEATLACQKFVEAQNIALKSLYKFKEKLNAEK